MLSLLSVATLVASTSFAQVSSEDDVTLIRANTGPKSSPLSTWRYTNDGPGTDFVGTLTASDLKIKAAGTGGKKPVRWAFPADWDGDGTDELVVIRELTKKKDKRLELRVYPSPASIFDNIDKILAKSKGSDFGVAAGPGKVVAVGAIDINGDGQDEVMVVREHPWGARFLEIRNLPSGKKAQMGNPIATDINFGGQAGLTEIIEIWGSDVADGGADEIVILSRSAGGADKVLVYAAPLTLFADSGPPIATFDTADAPTGFLNVAAGRIYLKDNGPTPSGAEFMVFAQINETTGDQRVAVHDLPLLVGATLLPAVMADVTPGFVDPQYPIISVFGTRDNPPPPPPPPPQINGNFTVSFDGSDLSGSQVTIGPFNGAAATVGPSTSGGTFDWNLTIKPGSPVLVCPVDGEIVDGAIVTIPQATTPPPITYYTYAVTQNIGIATVGDTITWPGMTIQINAASIDPPTPLTMSGSDGNCTVGSVPASCGALLAPDGTTVKAWILGITFTKI